MAKNKTKPHSGAVARREVARRQQAALRAQQRRRLIISWLIGVVIIGLIVAGITIVVLHVKAGEQTLAFDGPKNVQQISPPNATGDGLAIVANPDVKLVDDAITVDVHVDYQSRDALNAMQFYGQALSSLANDGKIRLLYHLHIAQDDVYNNTSGGRAVEAATCADTVGAFTPYLLAAFMAAPLTPSAGTVGFTDAQLKTDFAATAGITGDDLTRFLTCYSSRATSAFVKAMDAGNQIAAIPGNSTYASGVTTTPVFLANNIEVDITTDMFSATTAPKDADGLLTLLQKTVGTT